MWLVHSFAEMLRKFSDSQGMKTRNTTEFDWLGNKYAYYLPLEYAGPCLDKCRTLKSQLRFQDEKDFEYEIFSILSSALRSTSAILAGPRDSLRHSTTSFSKNVLVVD